MKRLFIAIILIVSIMQLHAQTKSEKDVANAVEQLRNAMVEADSAMLEKLTLPKLSYGHSGGHIDVQKEFVQKIVSGKSDFVTLEFAEQTISVNKNVALVRHKFNAITNDGGKPGEVHLAVLLIWQKLHGDWKLLARQAIKVQ
ncbi:MAG: nuclear transport factor 2 family protein [Ferruginibacter sp.]